MLMAQVPGLKALIVDETTNGILAASVTRTSLAEQAVVVGPQLLSTCADHKARYCHVRAIVWVRPTEHNIKQMCEELQNPAFGEYHICFSSKDDRVMSGFVQSLAVADQFELVRWVGYCLGECVAVSPEMFSLEISPTQEEIKYSERVRRLQSPS